MRNSPRADDLDAELTEAAEAAEANPDAPITERSTVTRGHGRSKILQIRLNTDELADLERLAATRGLPLSTVAREAIQRMLNPAAAQSADATRLVAEFTAFVSSVVGESEGRSTPRR